ncbi:MAG: tripartite tricarboxylate transporter TctB family protein [Rubrivivax sp.]|nr:tripartite tricarboxylate transporter TctB family protein [Rubrivivax sp.]
MTEPARRPDLPGAAGSALMLALGAAALYFAREFSDLGAVFPRAIGAFLVGLSALYIVLVASGRTRRAAGPAGSHLRRAGVAAVMLGWAYALPALGFLASSAVAMTLLMLLAQHDRWTPRRALGVGAGAAAVLIGLYTLFKLALQVPLP